MRTLTKSIDLLVDGKLSVFLTGGNSEGKKIYLQPPIVVDTLDANSLLTVRDVNNDTCTVDVDKLKEIDGVPFVGDFAALETAIRELAKASNSVNYAGGGASGGASEAKQDVIIEKTQELIYLFSGGNTTTNPMPTLTQASSVGVQYMMRTIKFLASGTMYIKVVETRAQTNDESHICIYKNANIADDTGITYSDIAGFPNAKQGTIGIDNPTKQIVTAGTFISSHFAYKDKLIREKELNIEEKFAVNDVFVFAVKPDSAGLDIEAIISMYLVFD